MNTLNDLVKFEIKRQYKSARQFALSIGLAPTTLASSLKNGIEGTSFDTVVMICDALGIKFVDNAFPVKIDDEAFDFLQKYSSLDSIGKHTASIILNAEYARCTENNYTFGSVAAFGGATNKTVISNSDATDAHSTLKNLKKQK